MRGPWDPNLHMMGMALRMRWLWLARTDISRTWSGYSFMADDPSKAFFDASIMVMVGDGNCALFWLDRFINGFSIKTLAPNL